MEDHFKEELLDLLITIEKETKNIKEFLSNIDTKLDKFSNLEKMYTIFNNSDNKYSFMKEKVVKWLNHTKKQ